MIFVNLLVQPEEPYTGVMSMGKVRIHILVEEDEMSCITGCVQKAIDDINITRTLDKVEILKCGVDEEIITLAERSETVTSIFLVSSRYPDGYTSLNSQVRAILTRLNKAAGDSDKVHVFMLHGGVSWQTCIREWPKVTPLEVTNPFPPIYGALNKVINPPAQPPTA